MATYDSPEWNRPNPQDSASESMRLEDEGSGWLDEILEKCRAVAAQMAARESVGISESYQLVMLLKTLIAAEDILGDALLHLCGRAPIAEQYITSELRSIAVVVLSVSTQILEIFDAERRGA